MICPHRETCMALKGSPIGMYHCPVCGAMVIAGEDPAPHCENLQTPTHGDSHG